MWPKSVRATKVFLVDGGVACYLTHDEVRELGRILIQPAGPGGSQQTCEVCDTADGRFDERGRLLELLGTMIAQALMDRLPTGLAVKQPFHSHGHPVTAVDSTRLLPGLGEASLAQGLSLQHQLVTAVDEPIHDSVS